MRKRTNSSLAVCHLLPIFIVFVSANRLDFYSMNAVTNSVRNVITTRSSDDLHLPNDSSSSSSSPSLSISSSSIPPSSVSLYDIVDPCSSRPCPLGAECVPTPRVSLAELGMAPEEEESEALILEDEGRWKGYKCVCPANRTGFRCEVDVETGLDCRTSGCQNGGLCVRRFDGSFDCSCVVGFTGNACEIDSDECLSAPCRNGGTCIQDYPGRYECLCHVGHVGKNCEQINDPCASNPCQNEGSCLAVPSATGSSGNPRFRCFCPPGLAGINCELTLGSCSDFGLPRCLNGGICRNVPADQGRHKCHCRDGWEGLRCHKRVNPCSPSSCHGHGDCVPAPTRHFYSFVGADLSDDDGRLRFRREAPKRRRRADRELEVNFRCDCYAGWNGRYCQKYHNPCDDSRKNPCQNGGRCSLTAPGIFSCQCSPPYSGIYCQYESKCLVNSCANGGTCRVSSANVIECDCALGFHGDRCDVRMIEENTKIPSNMTSTTTATKMTTTDATAISTVQPTPSTTTTTTTISTKSTTTTTRASTTTNRCSPNPCDNDAVCVDRGSDFECRCGDGWMGRLCETSVPPETTPPTTTSRATVRSTRPSPCVLPDACRNGGTCRAHHWSASSFTCECARGFGGIRCELKLGGETTGVRSDDETFNGKSRLLLHYDFESSFNDVSQSRPPLHASPVGRVVLGAQGLKGKGVSFRGGNLRIRNFDLINIGDQLTAVVWFKMESKPGGYRGIGPSTQGVLGSGTGIGEGIWWISNGKHFDGESLGGVFITEQGYRSWNFRKIKMPFYYWHFVAVRYDGRKLSVYLDGKLQYEDKLGGKVYLEKGSLNLGGFKEASNFKGVIDEVMILNKSLSNSAISQMYAEGRGHLPGCIRNVENEGNSEKKQINIAVKYDFNSGFEDASCNHWDGLPYGLMRLDSTTGVGGSSAFFDGASHVEVPLMAEMQFGAAFSVALWIRKKDASGDRIQGLLTNGDSYHGSWQIRLENLGRPRISAGLLTTGGGQTCFVTVDDLDEWHFVVFTYNGTAIKLYLDDFPPVVKRIKGDVLSKPTAMTIGRLGLDRHDGFFLGHLDDVVVFTDVLQDDAIYRIFHAVVEKLNSLETREP